MNSDRWTPDYAARDEERSQLHGAWDAPRETLSQIRNRLIPLCAALGEPKPPVEKPPFKDAGEQIAELSRLMIVHANEAKRFALIGRDIDEVCSKAIEEKA
jgi:hypothetical protein